MAQLTLEQTGGSPVALARAKEAWRRAELAIREAYPDGGLALEDRLERAEVGARRALQDLVALGQRAVEDHAAETLFDYALLAAGLSPTNHSNPYRRD